MRYKGCFYITLVFTILFVLVACSNKAPLNEKTEVIEGGFEIKPVYQEKQTTKDNKVTFKQKQLAFNLTYKSTFYGHDSAINRDKINYGWKFDEGINSKAAPEAEQFYIGSFNGDLFEDLIYYKSGKIYIQLSSDANVFSSKKTVLSIGEGSNFCGVGDYNADKYNDLLFIADNGIVCVMYGSQEGFKKEAFETDINIKKQKAYAGDVNGDGICDIVALKDTEATAYIKNETGFIKKESTKFLFDDNYKLSTVSDVNCDTYADVILVCENGDTTTIRTLFGRGDGSFGPSESEKNTTIYTNLYSEYKKDFKVNSIAAGDTSGDGVPDLVTISDKKTGGNYPLILISAGDAAYDYSMDIMKTADGYKMYSGCRWFSKGISDGKDGDGDHVMFSWSEDGVNWKRRIEGPMFYLGWELGKDGWWKDNTLEPEVIFVNGMYHMLWQCTYITPKGSYGDKIGYASSTDGINWERKIDEPVIVNCSNPEIGFNHEEAIYVADDPDGKCWWLYVGHFVDNNFNGYVRIRSDVPYRYNWEEREATSGLGQIGNQIGYVNDALGSRLFMRITFTTLKDKDGERTVPTFNISRDGLNWFSSNDLLLASVDITDPITANNKNVYFLGMSTINGTGEIERLDDGSYKIIYVATTANAPGGMPVFLAEGGGGVMTFRFDEISAS